MKKNSKDNNRLPSNRTPAPKGQDKVAPAAAGDQDQETNHLRVREVYFKPPLAIARVGGSDTPLESFFWTEDPTIHGGRRTTLQPAVTLEVIADGTVRPYFPGAIHFKDGGGLRPVAPFFELWVRLEGDKDDKLLTLDILEKLKVPLESVTYRIEVANRKAQRRTHRAADAFIARVEVAGNDHERKSLLGVSPYNAQEEPLVFADKPVPLGHFQVIRPTLGNALAVDLSALRVRFTPGRGEVYGPPAAVAGPASPLKQGDAHDPSTLRGRIHEIVPEKNRILNPKSRWCDYIMDQQDQMDPTPSDSYDGANVGENRSWGVVDDTCDGIIEATIVIAGKRLIARSRVVSSCPDFAPDRRPFVSFADNLADRDCDLLPEVNDGTIEQAEAEVADIFARVSEFASLVNLDATRNNSILANAGAEEVRGLPRVDDRTMTKEETKYANGKRSYERYADENVPLGTGSLRSTSDQGLPYADFARSQHLDLAQVDLLLNAMGSRPERFRNLLRPPYGRFRQLKPKPDRKPNPKFRDARPRTAGKVPRDTVHDMRMPPYMRDSDATALSLTWRQYYEIMALLDRLKRERKKIGLRMRPEGPLQRRRQKLLNWLRAGHPTPAEKSDPSPKIFGRNLTARAADWVRGNPVVTRPEDAVPNCFPGLEIDERNLDRRFFPGLVFEFVMWNDDPNKNGARLMYVDHHEDPDLRTDDEAMKEDPDEPPRERARRRAMREKLFNDINDAIPANDGNLGEQGTHWFLDKIEQGGGKPVQLTGLDGDVVWRLVRSLEATKVTIHLKRRDSKRGGKRIRTFEGWRRRFTDKMTGVISAAYQPGELLQSLCSPWQHDFRDCACHYWASNRPDVVYAEIPPGEALPGGLAKDPLRANERFDWMRADRSPQRAAGALVTMDENRPFQMDHFQINHAWQSLNVVIGDTEIGPVWVPLAPDDANPLVKPEDLVVELRKLAALEMALAFEYLYAMFSLRDPKELTDKENKRWPTLAGDLTEVRYFLLLTATSEMQHVRWVNEILWSLHKERVIEKFDPILVPAYWIPTGEKKDNKTADKYGNIVWKNMWKKDGTPVPRARALRPLTDEALQDFIAVEHPNGFLDQYYGRVVATLWREYKDLVGLAQRIVRDGMEHESRFAEMRLLLRIYGSDTPYLRDVKERTWAEVGDDTHKLFENIRNNLSTAYSAADRGQLPELGRHVATARSDMQKLLEKAEELAAKKVGLPFFEDFPEDKSLDIREASLFGPAKGERAGVPEPKE
jgi:hypothetical protein